MIEGAGGPAARPGEAASDRLSFDTADLPADEAFARYRELYGGGTEVLRLGPDVRARVEAWRLDRMLLYDRRLNDLGHRRDAARTQADGFDHFTATLLLAGTLEIEAERGGAFFRPRPGEVVLVDTHVPAANRMSHAHLVTLSIARERLAAIAGDVDALHGLILAADEARLYREFVESLLRNLPGMSAAATMAAAGVLVTLLSIAIDNSGAERRAAPSRDLDRLSDLRRLIDARVADPAFGTADAVRESGLSRATLYRLLGPEGGLATLIRHRRLETIRRWLGDRAETRSLADLVDAAGFASVSHASRAFAERYGIRPSEYRDVVAAGTGADAFFKMRLWQEEVR